VELIYRHRNWPATATSGLIIALAVTLATRPIARPHEPVVKPPVQLTLAELPEPPKIEPPKPQPPPPPEPPKPQPPKPTPPRPQTPPTPQPPKPVQAPVEAATSAPSAVSAPPPPPSPPAPPVETPPPPPPPSPAPVKVNREAEYVGKARAYLNTVKRYPTGREASIQRPSGTVRVWFILKRDGELVDTDIEDSSNSILLDKAALTTVRRGTFPPIPDDAWPGEAQHKFTVELEFTPN